MDLFDAEIFAGLDREGLGVVQKISTRRRLADGEMLFSAGQENHAVYILLSGLIEVRLQLDGSKPVKIIQPGQLIGEMSVIDGGQTSAYLHSSGESELLVIRESDFWAHLMPIPGLMRNLVRLLTRRFRDANEQAVQSMARQLQYEHLQKELAAAASIQMGMLPGLPLLQDCTGVDMHALLLPAKVVGGDLFDAFRLDEHRLLFAVGDVSGKGMPAALFMMRTLTLLRAHGNASTEFDALLTLLNKLLGENNEANMFVTLYVAILDLRDGKLLLLNGGHLPPLLSRQGGTFEEVTAAKGMLLGIMPGGRFTHAEIVLQPGDRILLFTDGVTEAENLLQEQFGLSRTQAALNESGSQRAIQPLIGQLLQRVRDFVGEAEQSDDITVIGLRYLGPEGA